MLSQGSISIRVRVVREERQLIQFREPNAYRAIVRKY